MMPATVNTVIIILAAGESARLGRPKQLLQWNGISLLNIILEEAVNSIARKTVLVLGSSMELIKPTLQHESVSVIYNENWREGMASSIIAGLNAAVEKEENVDGVIFVVCDQPYISRDLLNQLIKKHNETSLPIIASSYGNSLGTPAYFHRSMFDELLKLTGDAGAKKLIGKNPAKVGGIPFERGIVDIDTEDDFRRLKEKH